jgi:hypothetical protein
VNPEQLPDDAVLPIIETPDIKNKSKETTVERRVMKLGRCLMVLLIDDKFTEIPVHRLTSPALPRVLDQGDVEKARSGAVVVKPR